MIELQGICKDYRVARRASGLGQAVKALFSREYTTIHALKNISFTVGDGEIVGYIGPNGAGKSTTIKVMCGVLTPDSGTCTVNGLIPWKDRKEHVRRIGVVFGQRSQLWWDVPVIDSFDLLKDIYDIDSVVYKHNLEELTELMDLGDLLSSPTRTLSLGQRMRCEMAASLLHDPEILFLDEPTIGLDAVSKIAVRQFIQKRNREHGTTVILTTHDMQDIEALTDRILLIGRGQVLFDGSMADMKERSSNQRKMVVDYHGVVTQLHGSLQLLEQHDGRLVFSFDPQIITASEALSSISAQAEIRDVSITGATAEELVAGLYKEYAI